MICNSCERYKGGSRYYFSLFSVVFQAIGKFVIVFLRLILGKIGLTDLLDHITSHWIDTRYEFDFELLWKTLKCK